MRETKGGASYSVARPISPCARAVPGAIRPAMSADTLSQTLFAADPAVRYVAIYAGGALSLRTRPGLTNASAAESDRYEELLVNPALLTLARQRGEIDCGGLRYLLVRYGNFFQLVAPLADGHISIALEPEAATPELAERLLKAARDARGT